MDEPVRPDAAAAQDAAGMPSSTDPDGAPIPEPAPRAALSAGVPPLTPRVPPLTPRVLVLLVGAVVLGVVLYFGRHALGPFVVGLVLAYLLDIPVERMARVGVPRWVSVLLVYALVAVLFVLAIRAVVRPLVDEISTFIREFPAFIAQVTDLYAHLDLPPALREAIDSWLESLSHGVGGLNPGDLLPVVTGLAGVVGSIVGYVVVPVWVFYLIKDRPALSKAAEESMPAAWRADARAVSGLSLRVFGQWLKGQVFLGLVVGVATFIGLEILSMTVDPVFGRFAVLLSVLAGILELLPIIGPIIAAIPAVILGLTAGVDAAIAAVILYALIQQVENHILVPKIQGDAVELHPSIVIMAIVLGGAIAGIIGAILAVPITAAARDIFRYAFHRVDEPPATPEEALAAIRARPVLVEKAPDAEPPPDIGAAADAGAPPS
ncbi:MAG TPA: AI-2E family transporter [Candidatus Limnocylindrales bacterium]|nr:AI-2E family transporter [Candidatus Limnocylindrales bacterium]